MAIKIERMGLDPARGRALDSAIGADRWGDPLPRLERSGLSWVGGVAGQPLVLILEFLNPSPLASRQTVATVQVAPFGAFLPWTHLARVAVPPIPPGGRRRVTTTFDGDDVTRRIARTAPDSNAGRLLWMLWRQRLKAGEPLHFVGNLNVFVSEGMPVERHLRRTIGLVPGQDNVALFRVGDLRLDTYTFHGEVEPDSWELELVGVPWGEPIAFETQIIVLRMRPPDDTQQGRVTLWVERRSTRERVPIEFELSTAAPEAHCYRF